MRQVPADKSLDVDFILNYFQIVDDEAWDLSSNSQELVTHCPHCKKKHHFYINLKTKLFNCFKCKYAGQIYDDSAEAVVSTKSKLANALDILSDNLPLRSESNIGERRWFSLKGTLDARDHPVALHYLLSRGFSETIIGFYNFRYDMEKRRVVLPNKYNPRKQTTDMFVARAVDKDNPLRYLNPSASYAKFSIFNLHNVLGNYPDVIINEGSISAVSAGFNAVATYSKDISDWQYETFVKSDFEKYYIASEYDALEYNIALAEKLKQDHKRVFLIELPEGLDANDIGRREFLKLKARTNEFRNKFSISSLFYVKTKIIKKKWEPKSVKEKLKVIRDWQVK